jgi:hypothetical protein
MRQKASTCAWCGKALQAPGTAWLVNARAIVDVPEREGKFVPLTLAKGGRTITGFFLTSDSPAKRAGIDVIFSTCSQECTLALKAAVREEADDLGLVIE